MPGYGKRITDSDRLRRKSIGRNVKAMREQKRITQADLAERIGKPTPWLSMMEDGKTPTDTPTLKKIADALQCHPLSLFVER